MKKFCGDCAKKDLLLNGMILCGLELAKGALELWLGYRNFKHKRSQKSRKRKR